MPMLLVKCTARKSISTAHSPHFLTPQLNLPSNENAFPAKSHQIVANIVEIVVDAFLPRHLCIIFILFHLGAQSRGIAVEGDAQKVY